MDLPTRNFPATSEDKEFDVRCAFLVLNERRRVNGKKIHPPRRDQADHQPDKIRDSRHFTSQVKVSGISCNLSARASLTRTAWNFKASSRVPNRRTRGDQVE